MNETGTFEEEELDYFSRLPESVIHHQILSIIPFKDVVRCSVLSKKWNRIWCNYPNIALEFRAPEEEEFGAPRSSRPRSQRTFLDHIEVVLEQCLFRKACIQKLQFATYYSSLEEFAPDMDRWMGAAIERNVSELVLQFTYLGPFCNPEILYSIPQRVVVAHSLKVLEVEGCRFDDRFTCIELSNLQRLKLCSCQVVGENVLNKILSGCPKLEFLDLIDLCGLSLISISCNPRLKYFCIHGFSDKELKRIEIFSPSLETFKYALQYPCAIDLETCTALKHLFFNNAYYSAHHLPIHYLLPKLLCIESLRLLHLHEYKAQGQFKISSPCLKRLKFCFPRSFPGAIIDTPNLLELDMSVLGACNLDFKFSSWNVPKLEKVHMGFSVKSFSTVYRAGLEGFLLKLHNYESLRLYIGSRNGFVQNMIIHEKPLAVLSSSLDEFLINVRLNSFVISSFREEESLPTALDMARRVLVHPVCLSLICSSPQSIELLYKNLSKAEQLRSRFNTFELVSTQEIEHEMDSAWKSFINIHSTGYHTATIIMGPKNKLMCR
ncbi:PREDICTED: F-box/FBD/LRR-repeat protein At5g44980-like [Ipomoea nil]|uniref:F-box/FBD/LRR-repeat protein At5g44980-like n=1 Tax=Ipomoea nil TaxID=35883 RepID=UPI000901AD0B|nr:PREDICTED: F-box/FBD/LRR-repeat protein At5g44980-like [Ipomoea nil]